MYKCGKKAVFSGRFSFPFMTQRLHITFGEFWSASGGLLGFLIGFDVFILIKLFLTPLSLLIGWYIRKRCPISSREEKSTEMENKITANAMKPTVSARLKDIVVKYFINFPDTNMNRALRIKFVIEKAIYLVVRIIFFVATLLMCVLFLEGMSTGRGKYYAMQNSSITLPAMTMCVPFTIVELMEETDLEVGTIGRISEAKETRCKIYWDEFVEDFYLNVNYNKLVERMESQDYYYAINAPIIEELRGENMVTWSNSLIRLTHRYLTIKMAVSFEGVGNDLSYVLENAFNRNKMQLRSSTLEIFAAKVELASIGDDELLQKYFEQLQLRWRIVNMTKYTKTNSGALQTSPIVVQGIAHLSSTKLCFQLNEQLMTSPYDFTTVTVNRTALPFSQWSLIEAIQCGFECFTYAIYASGSVCSAIGSFDLLGRQSDVSLESDSYVFMRPKLSAGIVTSADINIKSVHEFAPRRKNGIATCVSQAETEKCKQKCRKHAFEDRCQCRGYEKSTPDNQ